MDPAIDKENFENVYSVPRSPMVTKQSVFNKPAVSSPAPAKKKSTVKSDEIARLKEEVAKKDAELAKQSEEIKKLQEMLREQEMASLKSSLAYFPHRVRQIHSLSADKAALKKELDETKAQVEHERKQYKNLQLHHQRQQRLQQIDQQQQHTRLQQQVPLQQALAGLSEMNYYPGMEDNYHPGEC